MSDKPLDVYVLYATDTEQRFIKVADDGCLAIFDDEVSAKRAKRRNPGTDYKQVNYYSQKQVDRLQAENEALRVALEDMVNQVERDTAMGLSTVTSGCVETALDVLERQSVEVGECSRCNGSGVIPAADKRIGTWGCKDCGGTGGA